MEGRESFGKQSAAAALRGILHEARLFRGFLRPLPVNELATAAALSPLPRSLLPPHSRRGMYPLLLHRSQSSDQQGIALSRSSMAWSKCSTLCTWRALRKPIPLQERRHTW